VIGQATLLGETAELTLDIAKLVPDRGELEGYLSVDVRHRAYRFAATCQVFLPPADLVSFASELELLARELSGTATLCRNPDYFQVRIEMRNGKGSMSGVIFSTATTKLEFDGVHFDQTYLDRPLREFTALALSTSGS
jgi:hypothetical protein